MRVSGRCHEGVLRVSREYLWDVQMVCWVPGQVGPDQVTTSRDRSSQEWVIRGRLSWVKPSCNSSSQGR